MHIRRPRPDLCVLQEGENVLSQSQQFPTPQVPPSLIPIIQGRDLISLPAHPTEGKGPFATSSWRLHRPGFRRLHAALPSSLPPTLGPPQGHPGHTHLPPLCLPFCLHPKMRPRLHQPVCAPPSGPRERPLCSKLFLTPGTGPVEWVRPPAPCPSLDQQWPLPITHSLPSKALKASPLTSEKTGDREVQRLA